MLVLAALGKVCEVRWWWRLYKRSCCSDEKRIRILCWDCCIRKVNTESNTMSKHYSVNWIRFQAETKTAFSIPIQLQHNFDDSFSLVWFACTVEVNIWKSKSYRMNGGHHTLHVQQSRENDEQNREKIMWKKCGVSKSWFQLKNLKIYMAMCSVLYAILVCRGKRSEEGDLIRFFFSLAVLVFGIFFSFCEVS